MKIWVLSLEPLETRYTGEWYQQFKQVFDERKIEYEFMPGKSFPMDLQSKFFLDPIGTNIWKCSQMVSMLERFKEVKDEDVFFTWDFWHPALECLAYARSFLGKQFSITAIAHAGTYDPWDLTYQLGMGQYGKFFEEGWFSILDAVFVATKFHKDLILKNRTINPEKIHITGLPADIDYLSKFKSPWHEKEGIVFTGRKSHEKGIDIINYIQKIGLPITIALDQGLKKQQYHELLGKSKIVFAPSRQETFGYGIVEGIAAGCIPVVPDDLSFRDFVLDKYRYKPYNNLVSLLKLRLETPYDSDIVCDLQDQKNVINKFRFTSVISSMLKIMESL